MTQIVVPIQTRRGTSAQWVAENPVLLNGECALVTDANYIVVGNGVDDFNTLSADQKNIYASLDVVNQSLVLPVAGSVGALASIVSQEISDREGADSALQSQIDDKQDKITGTPDGTKFAADDGTWKNLPSSSVPDASTTVKGIAKLSTAPVDPAEPVAVGDNDARMTNARTPTAHASSHTNGSDDIQTANGSQKGLLSAADWTAFNSAQKRVYPLSMQSGLKTHTGTLVNTIVHSVEINPDTIGLNDALHIIMMHRKTTGASASQNYSLYLNTSNEIGGDFLLFNVQGGAVTLMFEMYIKWLNSTTNYIAKQGALAPLGGSTGSVVFSGSKSTTSSLWLILAIQLTDVADVITQYTFDVLHYKN
jgi:hypothetical protein